MFDWMFNWVNIVKLATAGLVVGLNYALGWGLDSQSIAGIGAALAIPVELWGFVTELLAKILSKQTSGTQPKE